MLAVLVQFPFAKRPWALPVLVDLYLPPEGSKAANRRHRTPAQLMCRLLRLLLIRVPGRRFVFAGDSAYGTHEVARFRRRHRARLTLVSKLHPEANMVDPPGPYSGVGPPREAVASRRPRRGSRGTRGGVVRRLAAAGRRRGRVGALAQGG